MSEQIESICTSYLTVLHEVAILVQRILSGEDGGSEQIDSICTSYLTIVVKVTANDAGLRKNLVGSVLFAADGASLVSSVAVFGSGGSLSSNVNPLVSGCGDHSGRGGDSALLALVAGGVTVGGASGLNSGDSVSVVEVMTFLGLKDLPLADAAVEALGAVVHVFGYVVRLGSNNSSAHRAGVGVTAGSANDCSGLMLFGCLHSSSADFALTCEAGMCSVGNMLFAGYETAASAGPGVSISGDNGLGLSKVVAESSTAQFALCIHHIKLAGLALVVGKAVALAVAYALSFFSLLTGRASSDVILICSLVILVGLAVLVALLVCRPSVLTCRLDDVPGLVGPTALASLVSLVAVLTAGSVLLGNVYKIMSNLFSGSSANGADLPVILIVMCPTVLVISRSLLDIAADLADTGVLADSTVGIDPVLAVFGVVIAVAFELADLVATGNSAVTPVLFTTVLVIFAPLVSIGSLGDILFLGFLALGAGANLFTDCLAGGLNSYLPSGPLVTLCRDLFAALVVGAGVLNAVDGDNGGALITGLVALFGAGSILTVNCGCIMHCMTRKLHAASCASDGVGALKSGGIEVGRKNVMGFDHYVADCALGRSHAESSGVELMTGGSKFLNVGDVVADLALFPLFALFGAGGFDLLGLVVVAFSLYLSSADGALGIADGAINGDFLAFYVGDLVSIRSILVSFPCVDGLVAAFALALAGVAGRSVGIDNMTESLDGFGFSDHLGSGSIAEHSLAVLAGPIFFNTACDAGSGLFSSVNELMSKLGNGNIIAAYALYFMIAGSLIILCIGVGNGRTLFDSAADLTGIPVRGCVVVLSIGVFSRTVGAGGSKNGTANAAVVMVDTCCAAGRSRYKQILYRKLAGELIISLAVVLLKGVGPCAGGCELNSVIFILSRGLAASATLVVLNSIVADRVVVKILGIDLLYSEGVISAVGELLAGDKGICKNLVTSSAACVVCACSSALASLFEVLGSNYKVFYVVAVRLVSPGSTTGAGPNRSAAGASVLVRLNFRLAADSLYVGASVDVDVLGIFISNGSTGKDADTEYCREQQSHREQYLPYAFDRMHGLGMREIRN